MKTLLSILIVSVTLMFSSCKEAEVSATDLGSGDPLEQHWYPKKLSFLSIENGDTTSYWVKTTDLYLSLEIKSDAIIFLEHAIVNGMPIQDGAVANPGSFYTKDSDTLYTVDLSDPTQTANLYYELLHNNDSLKIVSTESYTHDTTVTIEAYTYIYSVEF